MLKGVISCVGADADTVKPPKMLSARVAICAAQNVREACLMGLRTMTAPLAKPCREIMASPIWTTWARYHSSVDERKVLCYAAEIKDRGLQVGPIPHRNFEYLAGARDGCKGLL